MPVAVAANPLCGVGVPGPGEDRVVPPADGAHPGLHVLHVVVPCHTQIVFSNNVVASVTDPIRLALDQHPSMVGSGTSKNIQIRLRQR